MARSASSQPTEVELQILRILWELGPSQVRAIHNALQSVKKSNYSTTVKMLSVMRDKGLVKRDESANPHVYRATATQDRTQRRMLDDLVQKVYDGSTKSLVLHALATKRASAEELEEIQRILQDMKQDAG